MEETFRLGGGASCGLLFFVKKYCFIGVNCGYLVLKLDPTQGYFVKGVFNMLTHDDQQVQTSFTNIIWNKVVPLKVSLFAWILLKNGLPTKDNLARLGVLHP